MDHHISFETFAGLSFQQFACGFHGALSKDDCSDQEIQCGYRISTLTGKDGDKVYIVMEVMPGSGCYQMLKSTYDQVCCVVDKMGGKATVGHAAFLPHISLVDIVVDETTSAAQICDEVNALLGTPTVKQAKLRFGNIHLSNEHWKLACFSSTGSQELHALIHFADYFRFVGAASAVLESRGATPFAPIIPGIKAPGAKAPLKPKRQSLGLDVAFNDRITRFARSCGVQSGTFVLTLEGAMRSCGISPLTPESTAEEVVVFLEHCRESVSIVTAQDAKSIFAPVIAIVTNPEFKVPSLTNSRELQTLEVAVERLTNERKSLVVRKSAKLSCDKCNAAIHRKYCLGMTKDLSLNLPAMVKSSVLAARDFYETVTLSSPSGACNFDDVFAFNPGLAREIRDQTKGEMRSKYAKSKTLREPEEASSSAASFSSAYNASIPPSDADDDPDKSGTEE